LTKISENNIQSYEFVIFYTVIFREYFLSLSNVCANFYVDFTKFNNFSAFD